MSRRRTQEDLIFPERVLFQLLSDYSEGFLTNARAQLLKRAVVIDVDTVGGQLEANPPNPPGSIRARVYSAGFDATTPNSALTIFHPLFPAHVRAPVERDEHVLVLFEDQIGFSSGMWITTVPAFRDLNFRDPEEDREGSQSTGDRFEGTGDDTTEVDRDVEFGGLAEEAGVREEIISSFETLVESPFSEKNILHIGDDFVDSFYGREFGAQVRERDASNYETEGRVNWGVYTWNRGRLGESSPQKDLLSDLIESKNPDVVIISLGFNDYSVVNNPGYRDQVAQLWEAVSDVQFALWIGPPSPAGPLARVRPGIDRVAQNIRAVVGARFIDSRDLTRSASRATNGKDFTAQGGENWARQIITRIERSF